MTRRHQPLRQWEIGAKQEATTRDKPKAVLCDLDGVLRLWDPLDDLDRRHGLPPGTLATAAFAPHRLTPAITGRTTDEDWRAAVAVDLVAAGHPKTTIRHLIEDWTTATGRVDHAVADILHATHLPVVLVTNATTRLEADLRRLQLPDTADHVINSARLGIAKPDPRIYEAAAATANVPPHHCLFVDDTEANVTTATNLGMTALHYRHPSQLRHALGLPDTAAPER